MKRIALIGLFSLTMWLAACGGDSQPEATAEKQKRSTTPNKDVGAGEAAGTVPAVHIPPGPPPKNLIVRELKKGSGKEAVAGDELSVRYVAVDYKTKKVFQDLWNAEPPYGFVLGQGEVRKGWEIGLKGIKVGGRRELLLPSRLAYGEGALAYVVELIGIEKLH
jgi:peptidylprolyl isomerase